MHPRIRGYKARPTNCCCDHTHVCCKINQIRAAPRGRTYYQGSADQMLLQAYQRRVALRVKVYEGLADQTLQGAYTCVWQNKRIQGCSQGSKVAKAWPTSCFCEHTHVCCRIRQFNVAQTVLLRGHTLRGHMRLADQSRVAPMDQRLQTFGRPIAAVSTHMCLEECAGSELHPSVNGDNGVADQLLLRAYTSLSQNKSLEGCTRGPRATKV